MRNYPLTKKFEEPLLAALHISRDPLLVSLKFETQTNTQCRSQKNKGNKLRQKQNCNDSKEHNDLLK